MGSRKPSANRKRVSEFKAEMAGLDMLGDAFERESRRNSNASERHDTALREKACASKRAYNTLGEAEDVIDDRVAQGAGPLHAYECPYCGRWHITSKPE